MLWCCTYALAGRTSHARTVAPRTVSSPLPHENALGVPEQFIWRLRGVFVGRVMAEALPSPGGGQRLGVGLVEFG